MGIHATRAPTLDIVAGTPHALAHALADFRPPDETLPRLADPIAVLHIDTDRLHTSATQAALRAGLRRCLATEQVMAIVLVCGRTTEDAPLAGTPALDGLLAEIEHSTKPVVACMAGAFADAELALALACHGRVASREVSIRLAATKLGLMPEGGIVDRLPRRIGVAAALDLAVLGLDLDGMRALRLGLLDTTSDVDVRTAALRLAASLATGTGEAIDRCEPVAAWPALFEAARQQIAQQHWGQTAPSVRLEALWQALHQPTAHASARHLGETLRGSAQARALRHATDIATGATCADAMHRLSWALLREAIHLVDEGATPHQVDEALTAFGFADGPFAMADRTGLSHCIARHREHGLEWDRYSPTLDLMVEAGRDGAACGAGWHDYSSAEDRPQADPQAEAIVRQSALSQRLRRRDVGDDEIVNRCLGALVAEGLHLVDAGILPNLARVDAACNAGLGFPRWRGGPMYAAGHRDVAPERPKRVA